MPRAFAIRLVGGRVEQVRYELDRGADPVHDDVLGIARRADADWSLFDEDRRNLTRHRVELIGHPGHGRSRVTGRRFR